MRHKERWPEILIFVLFLLWSFRHRALIATFVFFFVCLFFFFALFASQYPHDVRFPDREMIGNKYDGRVEAVSTEKIKQIKKF